jgi:hypothetical protein
MKKLSVAFVICGIAFPAFGQSREVVSGIRSIVKRINSDSMWQTKFLDNAYFVDSLNEAYDGGQTLTGLFKDGKLEKINAWVGLSLCILTVEYYVDHGSLIFAYEQEKAFPYIESASGEPWDYEHPYVTFEGRYYFNTNKLIKKIENDTPECTTSWTTKELLSNFHRDVALLQKQKFYVDTN